jgi:hypothetical protein
MIIRGLSRLLWLLLALAVRDAASDETTCMTTTRRYADDASVLHFVCFCDSPRQVSVGEHVHRDDYFSLADFAYNLSGAIFAKAIAVSFQSCRFLRVLLDQSELTRIGSPYFRPDIAVRAIDAEHVYHLDLRRHVSPEGSEYLNVPAEDVNIGVRSVALVSVDRGAKFGSLHTSNNSTALYIDLNEAAGDEELNVQGFSASHVYFVTSTKEEVPLKEVRLGRIALNCRYYRPTLTAHVELHFHFSLPERKGTGICSSCENPATQIVHFGRRELS